jgi:hypothetical protein
MRTWTLAEANEALPRVRQLVERIRATRAAIREGRVAVAARTNGQSASDGRRPIREAMEELMAEGIVLRDPDRGLVDFPAVAPSGRRYWLCWIPGEPEVAWWHWEHDGFAGRKPLTTPPE